MNHRENVRASFTDREAREKEEEEEEEQRGVNFERLSVLHKRERDFSSSKAPNALILFPISSPFFSTYPQLFLSLSLRFQRPILFAASVQTYLERVISRLYK
jgi:hypothetical protein